MGNKIGKLIKNLFDYPIKHKPISFFRQEDFSSTGDALFLEDTMQQGPIGEYDSLVESFCARLRQEGRLYTEDDEGKAAILEGRHRKYPGWDKMTISNLHSLFLIFDKNQNGLLNYNDFSAVLESLGDETSNEYRKQKFDEVDRDIDGWITYEEFIDVIYYFHHQDGDSLIGLAKLSADAADNSKFIQSLSVREQLEYGLF